MDKHQDLYAVLYTHRFGENQYIVKSDHEPTQEEILTACNIDDFEPDREEFLEWEKAGVIQI